jgi:hypothetical protein
MRTVVQEFGDWCSPGWVADPTSANQAYNPNAQIRSQVAHNVSGGPSCGQTGNQLTWAWFPGRRLTETSPTSSKAGVNCYGVRPTTAQSGHTVWPFHPFKKSMYDDLKWTPQTLTATTDNAKVLECMGAGGVYTNGNNSLYPGCTTGVCCIPSQSNWVQNQTTAEVRWTGYTPSGATTADRVANCVSGVGVYTNGSNVNYPGCGTSACCVPNIYNR